MIGIIGAMDEEVEQIVAVMDIEREETKAQMTFKAGKLSGNAAVSRRRVCLRYRQAMRSIDF